MVAKRHINQSVARMEMSHLMACSAAKGATPHPHRRADGNNDTLPQAAQQAQTTTPASLHAMLATSYIPSCHKSLRHMQLGAVQHRDRGSTWRCAASRGSLAWTSSHRLRISTCVPLRLLANMSWYRMPAAAGGPWDAGCDQLPGVKPASELRLLLVSLAPCGHHSINSVI